MATEREIKEFALSQLAPYYADSSTCGYNAEMGSCLYVTDDGRMCVAGKNMVKPKAYDISASILAILEDQKQEDVFKPEVVDVLTNEQWGLMQRIHDCIALKPDNVEVLKLRIKNLGLFTFEELVERAETLKKVEK